MKKYWLYTLSVLVLLSACSKDETLSGNQTDEPTATEEPTAESDVPIVIRTQAPTTAEDNNSTRAIIESDENQFFEAEGLGIYCLAEGKLNANATDIKWSATTGRAALLKNIEANTEKSRDNSKCSIVWAGESAGKTFYYPISSWYKYTFYGYYPRTEDVKTGADGNFGSVTATIEGIDGTKDIIWGKSGTPDNAWADYAYSAKYFHEGTEANPPSLPVIAFKHMLTQLRFKAISMGTALSSGGYDMTKIKNLQVTKVEILNQPSSLSLNIAGPNEGIINSGGNNKDYSLKTEKGNDLKVTLSETHEQVVEVGDCLLVMKGSSYKMRLTLKYSDKDDEFVSEEVEIKPDNGDFEAGKSYTIQMKIYGPQTIEANATLAQWENGGNVEIEF